MTEYVPYMTEYVPYMTEYVPYMTEYDAIIEWLNLYEAGCYLLCLIITFI